MPINNDLERRMKKYYEQIPKIKLMRRTPVIIRIDGRAFHSFTKNLSAHLMMYLSNLCRIL